MVGMEKYKETTERSKKEKEEQAKLARISNLERRKLEGKTLIYTPRACNPRRIGQDGPLKVYEWQKIEIAIKDFNTWEAEEIYYGVGPEDDELLHLVAMISRDSEPNNMPSLPMRRAVVTERRDDGRIDTYNSYNWKSSLD